MMKYKKLVSFDFDETLCLTPGPEIGKKLWRDKMGYDWGKMETKDGQEIFTPYIGWWSKQESIWMDDPQTGKKIFDIKVNPWVYEKYLEEISDEHNYVILATGRLRKSPGMVDSIMKILNKHNLSFDEIHLNWGGDTFNFKTTLFNQLIKKLNVSEFTMYDDRLEHLIKFKDWAKEQQVDVTVVDVVNKQQTNFKNI